MGRHLKPRFAQVILVSRYLLLKAVNWSNFLCSDPKQAKKYEIEYCSRSSETINWSANSFQINHVTSMSWKNEPAIWSWDTGQWLSCFGSCQLTILWIAYIKDEDLPTHPWDTPPFLLIVSPTLPVQSVDAYVRTYVRSVSHVTTKWKEVDHIPRVWGSVQRALRARAGAPIISNVVFWWFSRSWPLTHEISNIFW